MPQRNEALLEHLQKRRSVSTKKLTTPGPSKDEVEVMLSIASRVPDHGKLAPWRFIVCDKQAQLQLGEQWSAHFAQKHKDDPEIKDAHIKHELDRPQRAPLMIAVVSTPKLGKIPVWEQHLSAGAACMNLLHAAHALGYGANWLSEWPSYDETIKTSLGCAPEDQIAGFVYIGTPSEAPQERIRPDLADVVEWR